MPLYSDFQNTEFIQVQTSKFNLYTPFQNGPELTRKKSTQISQEYGQNLYVKRIIFLHFLCEKKKNFIIDAGQYFIYANTFIVWMRQNQRGFFPVEFQFLGDVTGCQWVVSRDHYIL